MIPGEERRGDRIVGRMVKGGWLAGSVLLGPWVGLDAQIRNPALSAIRASARKLCSVADEMGATAEQRVELGSMVLVGRDYGETLERTADFLGAVSTTGLSHDERTALRAALAELTACEKRAASSYAEWRRELVKAVGRSNATRRPSAEAKAALNWLADAPSPDVWRHRIRAHLARLMSGEPGDGGMQVNPSLEHG